MATLRLNSHTPDWRLSPQYRQHRTPLRSTDHDAHRKTPKEGEHRGEILSFRSEASSVGQVRLPHGWELYVAEALKKEDIDGLTHIFHAMNGANINMRVRCDGDKLMPVLTFGRYSASIFARKPITPVRGDTLLDLAHRMKRSDAMKYRIRELGGRCYNFRQEEIYEHRQYECWLAAKRQDRRRAAAVGFRVLSVTLQAKQASFDAADRLCRQARENAEREHMLRATFETRRIVQARWEWRRTAEESLDFSEQDIGLQVSIMWAGKGGPREAKIINYDRNTQMHAVRYASGNVKVYDMCHKQFRVTRPVISNGRIIGNGNPLDVNAGLRQQQQQQQQQKKLHEQRQRNVMSRHGPSTAILQTHKVIGPGPAFTHVFENTASESESGTRFLQWQAFPPPPPKLPLNNTFKGSDKNAIVLTNGVDPGAQPPISPLLRNDPLPPLPILAEKIRLLLCLPGSTWEDVVEQAADTLGIVGSSTEAKYSFLAEELMLQSRIDAIHPVIPEDQTPSKHGNTYGIYGPRGSNAPQSSRLEWFATRSNPRRQGNTLILRQGSFSGHSASTTPRQGRSGPPSASLTPSTSMQISCSPATMPRYTCSDENGSNEEKIEQTDQQKAPDGANGHIEDAGEEKEQIEKVEENTDAATEADSSAQLESQEGEKQNTTAPPSSLTPVEPSAPIDEPPEKK